MINTFSKFYYGYDITSTNKYLDFNEGASDLVAQIEVGSYTLDDLCTAIENALNDAGALTYTCTANRNTRIITIAASGSFDLLLATGDNAASSPYLVIGFAQTDRTSVTTTGGSSAAGSSYSPQYKLQDYVSHEDFRELRDATVNKSASGLVTVQSFGTDRFFEFSIKFATNIWQPSTGPIINNSSGVANLQSFMQHCIQKKQFEFMPDSSTPNTFYRVILESTPSGATGYKLQEQFTRGISGYFETGILKLRIVED